MTANTILASRPLEDPVHGNHLSPQGVLIVEPWFTPNRWRAGHPACIRPT
jgi:hypothetical protein